jgi:hypothetical protein
MRLPVDPDEPKDDMGPGADSGLGAIDDPEPIKSVIPELTPIIVDVPDTPPPSDSTDPSPTEIEPPPDPDLLPQPWWRTSKPLRWAAVGMAAVVVIAGVAKIATDTNSEGGQATTAAAPQQVESLPGLDDDAEDTTAPEPAATETPEGQEDAAEESGASIPISESAVDPVGDVEPAFDDLPGIDEGRSVDGVSGLDVITAADIVSMEVSSSASDDETAITVAFNGAVRDIGTEEVGTLKSVGVAVDVLISRPGERVLNVLYRADGQIKISDIPPWMSISSEWVTPNELLIIITGLALSPNTQVEAFALIEAYGGFMSDVVSLLMASS